MLPEMSIYVIVFIYLESLHWHMKCKLPVNKKTNNWQWICSNSKTEND